MKLLNITSLALILLLAIFAACAIADEPDYNAGKLHVMTIIMYWQSPVPESEYSNPDNFFYYTRYAPFLHEQAMSAMETSGIIPNEIRPAVPDGSSFIFHQMIHSTSTHGQGQQSMDGTAAFELLQQLVGDPQVSIGMTQVFNTRIQPYYRRYYRLPDDSHVPYQIRSTVKAIPRTYDGSCLNTVLDDNETDLDCGGSCFPCLPGKKCKVDADCIEGSSCDAATSVCVQDYSSASALSVFGVFVVMIIGLVFNLA